MKEIGHLLQNKIIPWAMQKRDRPFIVARPVMTPIALPFGVEISECPIKGNRVIEKGRRQYANQRVYTAAWPQANLQEMALPKISCITSGSADYLLGKYCVHCPEGNFILIPPRAPHQCKGPFLRNDHLENGSCSLLQAQAYSKAVLVWQSHSRGRQHTHEPSDNYLIPNLNAVNIFNMLMEEAAENRMNADFACQGLMYAFFSIVAREIKEKRYMLSAPELNKEYPPPSVRNFSDEIREYLMANCQKPLRLKDAAAHMYMSTAQFTRRMQQETNTTFVAMLTDIRIERAKELLRETDWTFAAISSLLGFRSSDYFLSLFRRRVGYTPAEYRRRILNSKSKDRTKSTFTA